MSSGAGVVSISNGSSALDINGVYVMKELIEQLCTPDKLDHGKIAATARWLTRFVRASRVREHTQFVDANLDRGTIDELAEVLGALAPISSEAAAAHTLIQRLLSLIHISEPTRLLSISYAVFCL